jgi:hypothetical protein
MPSRGFRRKVLNTALPVIGRRYGDADLLAHPRIGAVRPTTRRAVTSIHRS